MIKTFQIAATLHHLISTQNMKSGPAWPGPVSATLVEHHDEKKLSTSLHYLLPEMYFKFKLLVTLPQPQQHLPKTFGEKIHK